MSYFSKSLLTGAGILLLVVGTGNALPPAFPTGSDQKLSPFPSSLSFFWQTSSPRPRLSTFTIPPEHVSITKLLSNGAAYHQRLVAVRGIVTQPELHLDESELFINFVFRLADGNQSVVVFGRHDRTQGAPSISLDLSVEVIGVFWKERDLHESHIFNTIEALTVDPDPPLIPENT
jgi:hypothetical protein